MTEAESFYGLQPRWLGLDRFYKVYVTPRLMSAARVAGQAYDPQAVEAMARAGYGPAAAMQKRAEREKMYSTVDPTTKRFLDLDEHNFQLGASEVAGVTFSGRKSWWTGGLPNQGVLTIHKSDGSTLRLILVGDQDIGRIQVLLKQAGFSLHSN
ncbi:MAG TPA: hypothetical protein VFS24_01935 [Steroidobacteraceae bacterium]|nr:hypothetical protein [Gemmatimonadaceae bacterium]HEU4600693.1 hypothetical protein [Steroidobacteraceae bacterium]